MTDTTPIWCESELAPFAEQLGLTMDEWIDHCEQVSQFTGHPILHVVGEKPNRLIQVDGQLSRLMNKIAQPDFAIDTDGTVTRYDSDAGDDPLKRDY